MDRLWGLVLRKIRRIVPTTGGVFVVFRRSWCPHHHVDTTVSICADQSAARDGYPQALGSVGRDIHTSVIAVGPNLPQWGMAFDIRSRYTLIGACTAVVVGCSAAGGHGEPVELPQPPAASAEEPSEAPDAESEETVASSPNAPSSPPTQNTEPQPQETFVAELTMAPRPVQMDQDDEAGASAAAEYFLFAYTYAYGTGDVGPLQTMAGPDCGFCASTAAGVAEQHSADRYMRAGDPVIHSVQVGVAPEDGVDYLVWLEAQLPQMRSYDAQHTVLAVHPASEVEAGFALSHRDGDWVVLGVTFEAGSA